MSTLPAPLTPPDCDVSFLPWFPLHHKRLTGSEWWLDASDFARSRNVDLWCEAFTQVPAASLPDKDAELAKLAGFGRDVAGFRAAKAEIMAPWVLCDDGRWYHPTLSEIAVECATRAQKEAADRAAARAADADRKRLARARRSGGAAVHRTSGGQDTNSAAASGGRPADAPGDEMVNEISGAGDASNGSPVDTWPMSAGRPADASRDEDNNRGIYITPPTPPAGGPRTSAGREDEERLEAAFDRAFRAFPLEGTASSPAEVALPAFKREVEDRLVSASRLADAAVAYGAWAGKDPARLRRTPAFHRWLSRGNYGVFLTQEAAAAMPVWAGPEDIWAEAVASQSEGWAKSWLARTAWRDLPTRAVVCRSRSARNHISAALGKFLAERDVAIILEVAA